MGKKQKFSKEEKIRACENYFAGYGSLCNIAEELNTHHTVIRSWCAKYKTQGPEGLEPLRRNKSYSSAFKQALVEEYLSGKISIHDLATKYNVSNTSVLRWIHLYNKGIESENHDPEGEIYTMKSRKTTFDERLEIVQWVLANDMNYKEAAEYYGVEYALVYQWVQKYIKNGAQALEYSKRGPKPQSEIDEDSLDDMSKLKLELEREKELRERAEFRLKVLKKKEEFEKKQRSRK